MNPLKRHRVVRHAVASAGEADRYSSPAIESAENERPAPAVAGHGSLQSLQPILSFRRTQGVAMFQKNDGEFAFAFAGYGSSHQDKLTPTVEAGDQVILRVDAGDELAHQLIVRVRTAAHGQSYMGAVEGFEDPTERVQGFPRGHIVKFAHDEIHFCDKSGTRTPDRSPSRRESV
ncbi:hypothetical protein [Lysobacter sp. Root559]|uniref:hypothetical protein n=1 Tax=Lysobacter sp. Root559 TaxID=1736559 RepID=UPI0012FC5637|nr:hypothetical protein [Lysobacter sp. Root559]